jgi:hypothetical protein
MPGPTCGAEGQTGQWWASPPRTRALPLPKRRIATSTARLGVVKHLEPEGGVQLLQPRRVRSVQGLADVAELSIGADIAAFTAAQGDDDTYVNAGPAISN